MAMRYAAEFVEGKVQEFEFGASSAPAYFVPRVGGKEVMPTTGTTYLYDADDTLMSTTSAGRCKAEDEGWVSYASATAQFNLGAMLTGATSGFIGYIRQIEPSSKTAGRMYLVGCVGTLSTAEVIADDGATAGSAKLYAAAGASERLYSLVYYSNFNLASTSSYTIGENYRIKVSFTYNSLTYTINQYADIVYYPIQPMVTTKMIDDVHPDWRSQRPAEVRTWVHSIHAGHAELCRRVRALGNRPAFIVKREELLPYEMAFIEAEIARNMLGLDKDARDYWVKRAESMWSSKGEFAYAGARDDGEVDASPKVMSYTLTR